MTYLGGKEGEGTAQTIINQQPPHDSYIEPFAGHAAIARWKRPALNTTLIDRDPDVTAWLAENTNGNLHLLTGDALEWLPAQHYSARTLIYCDPPYLIRSRAQPRSRYRFEMSLEDHERLLQILSQLPCMVQISAYADPLYSSYLRNWRHMTFQSTTRRGVATEHLWMSYPEPKALHTYTHLGADYRERERIKRKVTRWTARLAALPRLERLALYSAIEETINNPEAAAQPLPSMGAAPRAERPVTVLFTCKVSHYDKLPCVETYDSERDARTWTGGTPIVAHPPCAQWGRLHHLATVNPEEKALGPFAVNLVRANGGVLEHPAGSKLWPATGLPAPGERDQWGGFTLDVDQVVWGHPAQKRTWFYVCGCRPEEVPPIPAPGAVPTHRVTSSAQTFHRLPELSKHLRELTPPRLAAWLVAVARLCNPPEKGIESSFELTAAPASDR